MGGWGCPHEVDGKCQKVYGLRWDAPIEGGVVCSRFVWGDQRKNRPAGGWGGKEPEPPPEENNHPQEPSEKD